MKKWLLPLAGFVAVAALCGCAFFYQSTKSNKTRLTEVQVSLETLRAENDALKNQIAELEKKIEAEKQKQAAALKAKQKILVQERKRQLEEVLKNAEEVKKQEEIQKPAVPSQPSDRFGNQGTVTQDELSGLFGGSGLAGADSGQDAGHKW